MLPLANSLLSGGSPTADRSICQPTIVTKIACLALTVILLIGALVSYASHASPVIIYVLGGTGAAVCSSLALFSLAEFGIGIFLKLIDHVGQRRETHKNWLKFLDNPPTNRVQFAQFQLGLLDPSKSTVKFLLKQTTKQHSFETVQILTDYAIEKRGINLRLDDLKRAIQREEQDSSSILELFLMKSDGRYSQQLSPEFHTLIGQDRDALNKTSSFEKVQLLLQYHVPFHTLNSQGETPYQAATRLGRTDIAGLLKKAELANSESEEKV